MKILLVLGGAPPSHHLLKRILPTVDKVVAVDSGIDVLQSHGVRPDLFIGDMDSHISANIKTAEKLVLTDQNTTDLQKALDHIAQTYPECDLILLGAGGGRTDHLVNNLHICAEFSPSSEIMILNDHSRRAPFQRENIYRVTPISKNDHEVKIGSTISLFTLSEVTGLVVKGLKWNIKSSDSHSGLISQSNIAIVDNLTLTIDSGTLYLAVYQ